MLIIFDSHPVQYKAPVYQELARLRPGSFKVIYATDCSVRGYIDKDFGNHIVWDTPLLDGYDYQILNNENGVPLAGFRSLTGRGIFSLLSRERPRAVIISQFLYQYDLATYLSCVLFGIPVWIRHETQDEAFIRPPIKSYLRRLCYKAAYTFVSHGFYIGILNREHLLQHGLKDSQLTFSPYCVPFTETDVSLKSAWRESVRTQLGVGKDETMVLFTGKLIDKKNPQLLFDALDALDAPARKRIKLVFVGSGVLEGLLRELAERFPGQVFFAGFVNQSQMPGYYLAADILVLPSRRMGETWGLVVNEALHAGCAVIMTDAVGCYPEFKSWERVRVIKEGDAAECATAIRELSAEPRSFDWCAQRMESYSTLAAASAIAERMDALPASP
jgi:glycosyltransferase involved in cell wall biosynthesis